MKTKNDYKNAKSGDYLEQALYKGMTPKQKEYARQLLKHYKDRDDIEIPYGFIRIESLTK